VAAYAAVRLANPDFVADGVTMVLMFLAMGVVGTVIGASVRRSMVRYYFPSGTACAVIQKTVTGAKGLAESRGPTRLLTLWGSVAALWSLPVKLTTTAGGAGLLARIPLGIGSLGLSVDPLLYGIGIVVGPRIGLGMILGALMPLAIEHRLTAAGIPPSTHGDWVIWIAIAVLTVPTFAVIAFSMLFRTPPVVPHGFTPGTKAHTAPSRQSLVWTIFTVVGVLATGLCAQVFIGMPLFITVFTVAICWPLCIMSGRVAGDTDINPVRLVVIVLLSGFPFLIDQGDQAVMVLLGMAIMGSTLAGMAVDMMQDYRTGYLVNGNPTHQTSVQFIGAAIGAVVAVPFILLLDRTMGFGPESSLKAPGPQVYATIAQTVASDGSALTTGLITTVAMVSIIGCVYAFLSVWPATGRWIPSLFGIGIGLLLPFDTCSAIFVGGVIKWVVVIAYTWGKTGDDQGRAKDRAGDDTMLVGASIFAAAALVSVLLILILQVAQVLGIHGLHMAH